MVVRKRKTEDKPWLVGFAGTAPGSTNKDNVCELLNAFIPGDQDFKALLPDTISRRQKSLMSVWNWLDGYDPDGEQFEPFTYDKVPAEDIVSLLEDHKQDGGQSYLVLVFDEDKDYDLADQALSAGIQVKSLDDGLDDLQIAEAEALEEKPRRRGKPRSSQAKELEERHPAPEGPFGDAELDITELEVDGPATIVSHEPISTPIAQLERALRNLIREEIHTATAQTLVAGMDVKGSIKAFTNEDGKYELPGDRKKAPRGWRSVELTYEEAKDVGLNV